MGIASHNAESEVLLTVADVAKRLAVSEDTVLAWINGDKLPAIDVSVHQNQKPRWRISPPDLDAFLAQRRRGPKPKPRSRQKKRPPVKDHLS